MFRKLSAAALLTLLASSTGHAQEWIAARAGVGPTMSVITGYGTGAHVLAAASAFIPGTPFGFRLDGIATVARYAYFGWLPGEDPNATEPRQIDHGLEPILGGSLDLVLEKRSGRTRPYLFVGLGYYHSPFSDVAPPEYDFGPTFGVGILREIAGLQWFIELDGRVFGNTFYDRGSDKAFWPLTVGIEF